MASAKRRCCVACQRSGETSKMGAQYGVDELHTAPTCGHQLVEFAMTRSATARCERRARVNWRVWDVSGKENRHGRGSCLRAHSHAVVFVVDATDVDRLGLARKELHQLFRHPALKKMPLLVLCNKSGRPDAAYRKPVHADAEAPAPARRPTRRPSPTTRARRTRRRKLLKPGAAGDAAVVPNLDCGSGQGRVTTPRLAAQNRLDVRSSKRRDDGQGHRRGLPVAHGRLYVIGGA